MKLGYKDSDDFELYVMDLCESIKPKTCKDLERLSEELHESVECAISDYIRDSDHLNIDDYNNVY